MGIFKLINRLANQMVYGYKYSSKKYIEHLRQKGMSIGEGTILFNPHTILIDASVPYMIRIGKNVQITGGVVILAHDYAWSTLKAVYGDVLGSIRTTTIGDNVYIGMRSVVLAGASIGNNVVIGSNSVVSGNIPDNCVAVGNPCRPIYSLKEYHDKRNAAQLDEAVDIIKNYYNCYGTYPTREKLFEHFWLFENNYDNLPSHFQEQNALMPGSEEKTKENFINHEPRFANYEELLEYAKNMID